MPLNEMLPSELFQVRHLRCSQYTPTLKKQIAHISNLQTTQAKLSHVKDNIKNTPKRVSICFLISGSMLRVDGEINTNDSISRTDTNA
jgi:hypothetical protein